VAHRQAFAEVSKGKDVVLVGGAGTLADGSFLGIPPVRLARELQAQVLLVDPYQTLTTVEKLEAVLGRIRIREAPKVKRAQEFMRDRLNYRRIIQKLDVK
jgi:BioD-like phosphotransacetylase family protein